MEQNQSGLQQVLGGWVGGWMRVLDAALCSLSGSQVGTAAVLYFLGDAPFYGISTLASFRPAVATLSDLMDPSGPRPTGW